MFRQNQDMIRSNYICKSYDKSDKCEFEKQEINKEAKTDFSSESQIIKTEKSRSIVENESQVNSETDKISQETIKENFPFPTFLKDQLEILTEIVDAIEEGYKYIILESGVGKSAIAATLANIYESSFILSDNKKLQEKYHEEYDLINNDKFMFGKKTKVLLQDMDLIKWKQDLKLDKEKLEFLFTQAKEVDCLRDEKLADLKKVISNKIENPINEDNKKILIFTAFADTAKYLYENISQWIFDNYGLYTALVTGSGDNKTNLKAVRNTDIDEILTSFSPISKNRNIINPEMTEEIDILIGTDCISEGQNLQDCDYLINYDIHWNPVRIIQRFGRVDRIGSKNKDIQLVNFWPNIELDEYINLKGRVENRMVMVDVSATGEENIIVNNDKVMNDLEYRKNQLEKLKGQVIDLEDVSDAISITDLTFNDFKIELMEYMKEHRKELDNAPFGIYSIVPADEFEPGVIFLLRQVKGVKESKDKNALTPYYLVYISEDEEVKLNYIQSKKILDYYQKLCSGKKEVFRNLVESFDRETDNGRQMDKYSQLLKESIENIIGKKQETGVRSLFTKGGTSPVKNNIEGLEEFELISFLILK